LAVTVDADTDPDSPRIVATRPDTQFASPLPVSSPLPITSPLPGAAAADAPPSGRALPARVAAQPSTAIAAQLAQQDASVTATSPVATIGQASPLATDAVTLHATMDQGGAIAETTADEVAPARHALTPPADAGSAPPRLEGASETVATRTARMTMHPAIAQVAVSVTKAVQEGVDRITIKLQPPELGRIDVRLEVGVDG
jgi:flagellar hook-length control protein FliK